MKKSFMDRLFPHPSQSVLPLHEDTDPSHSRQLDISASIPRSTTRSNSRPLFSPSISNSSSRQFDKNPQHALSSVSLLHHNDPFLPIERASKALQETIQSLLDAQSAGLGGRSDPRNEDATSHGSLTPTPTTQSDPRPYATRTVPIRQPSTKKITLKNARKGLRKSMLEFVTLREDELRLLDSESQRRNEALRQVTNLESRTDALTKEIESTRMQEPSEAARKLRSEATEVRNEIQELEHRLLELKVRHRHLISQAEQIESSLESKASSYRNTLALVEKETRDFLKRPPVQQPFGNTTVSGMFALKPDRRTLRMAKEQWTAEQEVIAERIKEVESERNALIEGERIWSEALKGIAHFESKLRSSTNTLAQSMMQGTSDFQVAALQDLLGDLDLLIKSLQDSLDQAQDRNWNLLVCTLGAEVQACLEARDLLQSDLNPLQATAKEMEADQLILSGSAEISTTVRSSPKKDISSERTSDQSNESLRDTMAEFAPDRKVVSNQQPNGNSPSAKPRYESEDDEPPSDFLLSH